MAFLNVLTSYTIIQSLILAVRFFKSKKRHYRSVVFASLLVVIAIDMANSLLFFTDTIIDFPHLLRVQTPITFLYGPLLYFLIQSYVDKNDFQSADLLHGLPFIMITLSLIPIYSMSGIEKVVYFRALNESVHSDSLLYGFLRRIHIFIYLIITVIDIRKVSIDKQTATRIWMAFFGIWLISMYRFIIDFQLEMVVLDMIYVNAVILYLAFIFSRDMKTGKVIDESTKDELMEIMEKIDAFIIRNEGFKDNLLSVTSLSRSLKIPTHKISKAINTEKGKHFFDYLNGVRIEKAKSLLVTTNDKIESISYDVGYNSISVFNTAFKKIEGCTPRQFRKLSTS